MASVTGTLYTFPNNFRAFKALIAAQYSGAKIDVAKDFSFGQTNKKPEFLKKFPSGKVPAFESKSGDRIEESNAIAYYVGNEQLRGKNLLDQAHVQQWVSFADNEVLPAACTLAYPVLGIIQVNRQQLDRAKEDIKRVLLLLNDHLLTRTYLVGERVTLADIVVLCSLLQVCQNVLEPSLRAPYGNVNRWFTTLINQTQFKAVLGEVKLCEKSGRAVEAPAGKDQKSKKDKKGGKAEKKQEKTKAAPPPADDAGDDFDDDMGVAQPPSKDPFEQYPKGNFNMDDFKRFYSNNPEDQAIKYFWEKFDKENYSIWFGDYKYPEDLSLVFMSCNLMSGMMQRLDKMRKNAFGTLLLFGEDNNNQICGLFIWKGHDLAFTLSDDWKVDYDSYAWRKLDPDAEETKKLVTQYFVWEGEHKGLKFNQGKTFK